MQYLSVYVQIAILARVCLLRDLTSSETFPYTERKRNRKLLLFPLCGLLLFFASSPQRGADSPPCLLCTGTCLTVERLTGLRSVCLHLQVNGCAGDGRRICMQELEERPLYQKQYQENRQKRYAEINPKKTNFSSSQTGRRRRRGNAAGACPYILE